MTERREAGAAILSRIRRANGGGDGADEARRRAVAERLSGHPQGVVPARGQLPLEDRIALFRAMAEKASATTERIESCDALPEAVTDWLRRNNLPAELKMSGDPRFADAPFDRTALAITTGATDGSDLNALSHADGAVAESGTLVLLSGPNNPTGLNYLPDNHIVALAARDVEGAMEAIWPKLRAAYGDGLMPRSVNLVTGPSRSADIEQTLLIGAHGPRALHIIIVG
ncbi:LutC/YkgG family protein [Consotaella aegiceratis]|uniref:LutC/YkgG family protein n=1 Tax=Consotaella aegiceratis TaxID=3097961 RepID=UPI002F42C46E